MLIYAKVTEKKFIQLKSKYPLQGHYNELYEILDYTQTNRLTLKNIFVFCKLVYRAVPSFHTKNFFNKLRFFFYFYLDKVMLRLQDLNPDAKKLDPSADDMLKLFFDKSIESYWASKADFYLIMTDLQILSYEDILKSTSF